MNVLVIVASLLSCSLAAPTELLKAYELPQVKTIEYKPLDAKLLHPFLPYHGIPLTHPAAVEVKAAEGDEVEAHALPLLHPFPYSPAHFVHSAEEVEVKEVAALPVIHAAPHHYPAEVRTFAVEHAPVVLPHVAPKVVEVEGHPSVYHTSYHAETERVEHPVEINHHQVQHVQSYVHHAPAVLHHAPAAYHHAPAAYHHAAPAAYHHAVPAAYHHGAYAVKEE